MSFIRRPVSSVDVVRDRRYSVAIPQVPQFSPEQIKLIRCTYLLTCCYESGLLNRAKEYLVNLMNNKDNYTNVLISVYLEEIETDWDNFVQTNRGKIDKCTEIHKYLGDGSLDDVERFYIMNHDYIPLRGNLEETYRLAKQTFETKYGLQLMTKEIKQSYLGIEVRAQDLTLRAREQLFRGLYISSKDKLSKTAPYASNFVDAKSKRRVLERVLISLTDYECFQRLYEFQGGASYLSSFCGSVEKICTIISDSSRTDIKSKQVQLTHHLWKFYVSLLSAETLLNSIRRLYVKSTANVPTTGGTLADIKPDPGIYFGCMFMPIDVTNILPEVEFVIKQSPSDITGYLEVMSSYRTACVGIYESIEAFYPLSKGLIVYDKSQLVSPSSTSSRARRKVTLTEEVKPTKEIPVDEIYSQFSAIATCIKSQVKVLDQILA